jgi:hypothetical protein
MGSKIVLGIFFHTPPACEICLTSWHSCTLLKPHAVKLCANRARRVQNPVWPFALPCEMECNHQAVAFFFLCTFERAVVWFAHWNCGHDRSTFWWVVGHVLTISHRKSIRLSCRQVIKWGCAVKANREGWCCWRVVGSDGVAVEDTNLDWPNFLVSQR